MKKTIVIVLFLVFLYPGILLSAESKKKVESASDVKKQEEIARQEAVIANKALDAEQEKANAEIEQMRLNSEEETANALQEAELDLKASIEDFQKEEFPAKIPEENVQE